MLRCHADATAWRRAGRTAVLLVVIAPTVVLADTPAVASATSLVRELVATAFPELEHRRLEVREFSAPGDYFRTTFAIRRFVFGAPMRYVIRVNPNVWVRGAPEAGIRAIVAHELSHVLQLSRGARLRRLGLVRLLVDTSEARFERAADLETIARGFGDGLRAYREWLYLNVPADILGEKHKHYFSPEEIDAIQRRTDQQPALFAYWRRHVPLNLHDIEAAP